VIERRPIASGARGLLGAGGLLCVLLTGCLSVHAPRRISASRPAIAKRPNTALREKLALRPPFSEAWIVVRSQLAYSVMLLDERGGSFGVLKPGEAYVVRTSKMTQPLFGIPSPYGCLEAAATCVAAIEAHVMPGCVYFASISEVFLPDPTKPKPTRQSTRALRFAQLTSALALSSLDLTRIGAPRGAGVNAGPLGVRAALSGKPIGDWTISVDACASPFEDESAEAPRLESEAGESEQRESEQGTEPAPLAPESPYGNTR
jgi:hypothetical protein